MGEKGSPGQFLLNDKGGPQQVAVLGEGDRARAALQVLGREGRGGEGRGGGCFISHTHLFMK